jgi:hypothetical protein
MARAMAAPASGILFNDPEISAPAIRFVKIHPLVIFQMAHAYERCGDAKDRKSVGVLMGKWSIHDGIAIVHDCYPCLPSADPSQVVDEDHNRRMYDRHRELYQNEDPVGYYAFSQQRIEWPSMIHLNAEAIHIWMRPTIPPKLDVFAVIKSDEKGTIIASPIEHVIDASPDEQLGLSRLANSHGQGSLPPALAELRSLLESMKKFCKEKRGAFPKDKLIGRAIYVALQQANLKGASEDLLRHALKDVEVFLSELSQADSVVQAAENELALPFE